jgi:hypothetical protein
MLAHVNKLDLSPFHSLVTQSNQSKRGFTTEAQRHREEEDRAVNAFAFGSLNRLNPRLGDVPFRNSSLCLCVSVVNSFAFDSSSSQNLCAAQEFQI